MHYISANVKKLIEMKGLSISELSRQTGVSKATISRWFNEERMPRFDLIEKIASAYDMPIDFFTDDSFTEYWKYCDGEWTWKDDPDNEPTFEVAAGKGRINDGYGEMEHGKKVDSEYTRIRIVGDSMYPTLMQNDIVRVHLVTDDITPNDLAIVKINGEEATCKHVEFTDTGIWLRAENKDVFQDKFYTIKEVMTLPVTIIGVADAIIERKL